MAKRFLIWYWSPTGGGGSQFAVNLARRLALRFGDAAVRLSLHADDPSIAKASAYGFETLAAKVVTARRLPILTAINLAASARVLEEQMRDLDCVILPRNFAAAAPLAMRVQKPLVYVAHDPEPHPGDYAPLWQRATQAALLRKSARVIALSTYAAERLAGLAGARGKVRVAPLSAVYAPQTAASDDGKGPGRLLFAGRMIPYKGVDLLADALAQLARRTDWRLTVAGWGPALDAAMAKRFELFPQTERVMQAWLSEAELDALIADCHIVLAPYRSATQSGVLAQAMAFGKPSIVTPVGALPEQIGGGAGGWIAERADAPAFAAAMAAALDDPGEARAKGKAALGLARAAWEHDYWGWLEQL